MSAERSTSSSLDQCSRTPPTREDLERVEERRQSSWNNELGSDLTSHQRNDGLLPAFSTKHYSHLPTPQSPSDLGRYIAGTPYSPGSPIPQSSQSLHTASSSYNHRVTPRGVVDEGIPWPNSQSHQCMTPDSSPHVSRTTPLRYSNAATHSYHQVAPHTNGLSDSTASSSHLNLESSILNTAPSLPPEPRLTSPGFSSSKQPTATSSTLSSPFMAKLTIGVDKNTKLAARPRTQAFSPDSRPIQVSDVFSAMPDSSLSPPPRPSSSTPITVGGEMERIRQAVREHRLSQICEAENRRPDYLKRAKRSLEEADPSAIEEDERLRDRERTFAIGIMESPHKGRRLKLFQETSEESFEESLMAGGYGRYRTAEWVRQPQPLPLPPGGLAGTSNVVHRLEEVQEVPPSEKELKKRKRLAAFRSIRTDDNPTSKLYPVELEGKGRVLLDIPNELPQVLGSPESSSKKRSNRRKKKAPELPSKDKKALIDATVTLVAEELVEKPNWPDSEFPWRLRTEERAEFAKVEEEERLKWIERFLDSDSDDGDDRPPSRTGAKEEEEVLQPSRWGTIYENDAERPLPVRMGRGKMVPLLAHPEDLRKMHMTKRTVFPSDPGDARAALLAKRSVRALSYRQQRRQREMYDEDEDAELCICRGVDDGRELVQCDGCQTWYHLDCIGIRNIAELGREEDPWFCRNCVTRSRSPSLEAESQSGIITSEPTFVPTDDAPRERSSDAPFFQPSLQDSPSWIPHRIPKTPTRSIPVHNHDADSAHSASSWTDYPRHGPSTPKGHSHPVRVHTTNTPGPFDGYRQNYEETPFDPTSTPSRGIRFTAPFATPKNNAWSRPNPFFQTPLRGGRHSSNKSFGGPGSLSAALDDNGSNSLGTSHEHYGRIPTYDDSPIRRQRSTDESTSRRVLDSPLAPRLLDDSPVMRVKGKERSHDYGRGLMNEG